jgi:hypothetical protein
MEKENLVTEDKIQDAIKAKNIALNHLAKEGILVWSCEVVSICKKRLSWLVEICGKTFTGVVVIESKTGKVVTANKL